MAMRLLCLVLCAAAADAAVLRSKATGFVRSLEFKHQLRVCNAYPYSAALDVLVGKNTKLTSDGAMPYKACRDFPAPLKAGDKIDFKVGDASAGTFSVSDLPNNDAVLLLVIHRHDTLSTAVSFESHVFASLLNAQVAIIDTYKGAARATPKITDAAAKAGARSEELRYDSVVAVNPGLYEVVLTNDKSETIAKSALVAVNHESYVILRTGVEAQQGQSYPQDLVVYPRHKADDVKGSAARMGISGLTVAAALALTTLLA